MDSEEVLILSVEDSAECLCLGKRKVDKGKSAADPSKRRFKKTCRSSKNRDNCLVIVDGGDDDYMEVYGEPQKDCLLAGSGGDDKDVLECVVNGPKELNTLTGVQDEVAIVTGGREVAMATGGKEGDGIKMKTKKSKPSQTETDHSSPVSAVPDSTKHCLSVGSDVGYLSTSSRQSTWPTQPVTTSETNMNRTTAAAAVSLDQIKSGSQLHRTPTCWTNCPNCPPNKNRKYHLIDVAYDCPEWGVVSTPLTQAGFTVNKVQRIQNESLWERLCYEKQLMLRDRQDVNEQLLYHTSRTSIPVICEEGLDLRLSRNGMFGSGIYFSDSPVKCNCYWGGGGGVSATRYMFCCRVLLGEIKNYPKGRSEQLRREPPKPFPKAGEPKFYDSVMGNLSGQNEFVVYNTYRVMPEYVLHYSTTLPVLNAATISTPLSHLSLYTSIQARGMVVPCRKRGRKRGSRKK